MPNSTSRGTDLIAHGRFLACAFDRASLRIEGCSPGLAEVLGLRDPGEVVGRFIIDLFTSDSIQDLEGHLRSAQSFEGVVCTLRDINRKPIPVTVAISQATGAADGVKAEAQRMEMICIPIHDHRPHLEALEQKNKLLSSRNERLTDFTGLVVHDLRNAMHTVVGNVELLALGLGRDLEPKVAKRLARISQAQVDMAGILDGVTKYLRFEVGDYPMELTDLNALVDGMVDGMAEAVVHQPGRSMSIRRTHALPSLFCERQLVRELFQNLIGNAIKYTDKPIVEIEIGLSSEAGGSDAPQSMPIFYIKDNGVGIAPDKLETIFQPFTRADDQGLNEAGTGMGMTLVKKIVERHGGRIWLESKLNHGTTVNFSLGAPS
jgi:signal transduction histidine kinase